MISARLWTRPHACGGRPSVGCLMIDRAPPRAGSRASPARHFPSSSRNSRAVGPSLIDLVRPRGSRTSSGRRAAMASTRCSSRCAVAATPTTAAASNRGAELLARQPASFDPLGELLAAAHRSGLRVHAWVNVSLVSSAVDLPDGRDHLVRQRLRMADGSARARRASCHGSIRGTRRTWRRWRDGRVGDPTSRVCTPRRFLRRPSTISSASCAS